MPSFTQQKKVIMTHFGRSGSTVLGQHLDSHSEMCWLSEVLSNHFIRDRKAYNPTAQDCHNWIASAAHARGKNAEFIGFEVKPMNFRQSNSCTISEFLSSFDAEPVLHIALKRKNTLKRYLSIVRAAQSGVYHTKTRFSTSVREKYDVPLTQLHDYDTNVRETSILAFLRKIRQVEQEFFDMMSSRFSNSISVVYEEHIETNPELGYQLITDALNLTKEASASELVKTGAAISEDVRNYDKLVEALQGSEFEWMLDA